MAWEPIADITGPVGTSGPGVPTGGAAGQVLVKASATNFDAQWRDDIYVHTLSSGTFTLPAGVKRAVLYAGIFGHNTIILPSDQSTPTAVVDIIKGPNTVYDVFIQSGPNAQGRIASGLASSPVKLRAMSSVVRATKAIQESPTAVWVIDGDLAGGPVDQIAALAEDTGWVNLAIVNDWTIQSSRTPRIRRLGNQVFMTGQVTGGSAALITTMPVEFSPSGMTLIFPNYPANNLFFSVNTLGQVSAQTAGQPTSLVSNWILG